MILQVKQTERRTDGATNFSNNFLVSLLQSRGLSYLDMKNILMLNYNCDLVHLIKLKTEGK